MNRIRLGMVLLLAVSILGLFRASAVYAADAIVTNCSNDLALKSALGNVQNSGGGKLTFDCGTTTINLSSQIADIVTPVVIDGGNKITLSGLSGVRPFHVPNAGYLTLKNIILERGYAGNANGGAILAEGRLALDHITIRNTYAPLLGGAIYSTYLLDIKASTFSGNISGSGGALYVTGTTTISDSTFSDNEGTSKDRGGAIYSTGQLSITNSQFTGNHAGSGGALFATKVVATDNVLIAGSTFQQNQTTGSYPNANGGAVLISEVGSVTAENSRFETNAGQSGGAFYILEGGRLTITDSTLRNNTGTNGGGIFNYKGTATLTGVTLSGNKTSHGGGIDNFGTLAATNSTFSGNEATYGGGLKNEGGTATLTNVTFANNRAADDEGGGIFNTGTGTQLTLLNDIVANSPAGGNCKFSTAPTNSTLNLSSDATCNFGGGRDSLDLKLNALGNNGGQTQTHLPKTGSPAINSGTSGGAPTIDQRGIPRPQGSAYDVGSVEVVPAPPTNTPTATQTPTRTPTKAPTPSATPKSTCQQKPAKPTLKAPADNATLTKTRVTLKWSAASCATSYTVIVKNVTTGHKADKANGLTALKYKTDPLPQGAQFKWYVKACNAAFGCAKSAGRTFTVQ